MRSPILILADEITRKERTPPKKTSTPDGSGTGPIFEKADEHEATWDLDEERWEKIKKHVEQQVGTFSGMHWLGRGSYGQAYDIGNGRVLKITTDMKEAQSAAVLLKDGKKDGPIMSVLYVASFKYPELQADGTPRKKMEQRGFVIVQELLEKPDAIYRDYANSYREWCAVNFGKFVPLDASTAATYLRYLDVMFSKRPQFDTFATWLRELAAELQRVNIKFHDLHGGNIMQRPSSGQLVLIDLGQSKTVKPPRLPTIARKLAVLASQMRPRPDLNVPLYDRRAQGGNYIVCWSTPDGVVFSDLCRDLGYAMRMTRQHKRAPCWVLHGLERELDAVRRVLAYRTEWLPLENLDRQIRSLVHVAKVFNLPLPRQAPPVVCPSSDVK